MKTGIVIVPFVDGKTGNAYQINDDFKANKTLCLNLKEVKSEILFSSAILLKLKTI